MRSTISLICIISALAANGATFAYGTEQHGKSAKNTHQMKKLHAIMPMLSTASARLEKALDEGDTSAAEAATRQILATIPDLKKSTPHRNIKQKKQYVGLAGDLEQAVSSTLDLAKKRDKAGAKAAFRKAEEACAACHEKFRD
ncbi:cytochrome c [Geotalea toluenoxydans]